MNSKSIRLIPLDYDGIERLKELYEDGHGGFGFMILKKFKNVLKEVLVMTVMNKFKMDLYS